MCLAIPSRVVKVVSNEKAIIEADGISRVIDVSLIKNIKSGDYILVHEGLGIRKMDREDAEGIIKLTSNIRD